MQFSALIYFFFGGGKGVTTLDDFFFFNSFVVSNRLQCPPLKVKYLGAQDLANSKD